MDQEMIIRFSNVIVIIKASLMEVVGKPVGIIEERIEQRSWRDIITNLRLCFTV